MTAFLLLAETEPASAEGSSLGRFLAEFWPVLVPAALGLAAVYLLLPRARRYPPWWGGLLGGLAVVVAGWWLVHFRAVSPEAILFYAFAGIAVLSAGLMITHSNPVYAALSFAMVVLATCGLFLLLAAPFLTAATVIIYAGAIIVTFLFVIMLAQQLGYSSADQRSREPFLASLAGFVLLAAVLCTLHRTFADPSSAAVAEQLRTFVAQARKGKDARSIEEIRGALGDDKKFFQQFRDLVENDKVMPPRTEDIRKNVGDDLDEAQRIWNTQDKQWSILKEKVAGVTLHLKSAYEGGAQLYARLTGRLEPDAKLPASPFALPPQQEGQSQPGQLPAENVAGLGRALFTDYLLPVELAGFLLLVATIGAIAIAARRTEGLR
jgi:NADH-quinone oxidoreductase subunit J